MPKTDNGQGYSDATPYKQEGFGKVLAKISNIAFYAQKKHGYKEFVYIDCNSGCGFNGDDKGSPLIAMDILSNPNEQRRSFDNVVYIFCDKEKKNIKELQYYCRLEYPSHKYPHIETYYYDCDNDAMCFYEMVKDCVEKSLSSSQPYGLIYSDPNGSVDYPIDNINQFAQSSLFKRMDILINFNTNQHKRNRLSFKDNEEHQRRHLKDIVSSIQKKKQFVRKYYPINNPYRFAHFLFTNYAGMKDYKGIDMYDINSKQGSKLYEELCFTQQELVQMSDNNEQLILNFGDT